MKSKSIFYEIFGMAVFLIHRGTENQKVCQKTYRFLKINISSPFLDLCQYPL
jgi:hypothetical protein